MFQKQKDRINMSSEVAVMKKLAKDLPEGRSPYVTLLDWYDLGQKLILVMERPVPAEDLTEYISKKGGCLDESEAKVPQKGGGEEMGCLWLWRSLATNIHSGTRDTMVFLFHRSY